MHAEQAVEGPFAMELDDWREVGWIAGQSLFGYDVLAGVIAFGGAVPKEEAVEEWYAQAIFTAIGLFAVL